MTQELGAALMKTLPFRRLDDWLVIGANPAKLALCSRPSAPISGHSIRIAAGAT